MWPSVLSLRNCKDIYFSLLKAGSVLLWGQWTSAFMLCFFPLKTALAWGKSLLLHLRSDSELRAALHTRPLYFLHALCSLYYLIPTLLAWEIKEITSSPAKWSAIHLHNLNHAGLEFHLVTSQFTQFTPAQTLCCWDRDSSTKAGEGHYSTRTSQPPSQSPSPQPVALQQVRNNFRTWVQTRQALKKKVFRLKDVILKLIYALMAKQSEE